MLGPPIRDTLEFIIENMLFYDPRSESFCEFWELKEFFVVKDPLKLALLYPILSPWHFPNY